MRAEMSNSVQPKEKKWEFEKFCDYCSLRCLQSDCECECHEGPKEQPPKLVECVGTIMQRNGNQQRVKAYTKSSVDARIKWMDERR